MSKKSKEALKRLLEILSQRGSPLLKEIENVSDIKEVPRNVRNKILDELGDEFCEKGLKEDSEPNPYGLEIEDLTDYCNITNEM